MATNIRLTKVRTETTYSMRIDKEDYIVLMTDSGRRGGKTIKILEGTLENNNELLSTSPRYERILKAFKQLSSV